MFITVFAWVYISFLSWTWGAALLEIFKRITGETKTTTFSFSITCLTGLAAIGTIAQLLSLFYPMGTLFIQLLFLVPSLLFFVLIYLRNKSPLERLKTEVRTLAPVGLILLVPALLLILIMSVHPIYHPDTLAYHSQIIKWLEQYPAVPGLVHLNYHYGFQNTWFILSGLFSFKFTGSPGLTFVNSTVLSWWVFFLAHQISSTLKNSKEPSNYISLLWLSLLAISLWGYTQLRLTASSASPDFICAIYVLLIGYLFINQNEEKQTNKLLVLFLCFFAITVKLAALPVLLFAASMLYPFRRKIAVAFIGSFLVVMVPFFTRNIITSGYPVFPSGLPDISQVDWKYSQILLPEVNDYITTYARFQDCHTPVSTLLKIPFSSWIYTWFRQLAYSDKLLLGVLVLSLLYSVFTLKNVTTGSRFRKVAIFTCLCGLTFWFFKAPDPRFGMGFILLFIAITLTSPTLVGRVKSQIRSSRPIVMAAILLSLAVSGYIIYRSIYYLESREVIMPSGIVRIPYKSVYKEGIKINVPLPKQECGTIDIPCSTQPIDDLLLRGKRIEDGFKTKKD